MSHHRRALAVLLATVTVLVWACLQLRQLAAGSWSAGLARAPWRQVAHDPAAVQSLAGALAASAALAICTWLLLGVLLSGVAALAPGEVGAAGARAARAVAPALIRNAVAALLGVVVVVPLAAPAVAAPGDQRRAVASVSVTGGGPVIRPLPGADPRWQAPAQPRPTGGVDPGWVPTRPAPKHRARRAADPPVHVAASPARRPVDQVDDDVVVRAGDTLWSLAARHLGRDASDAQIALEWPTWFEANRSTIGPDPDRLLPGMRLHVPDPTHDTPHDTRHDATQGGGR